MPNNFQESRGQFAVFFTKKDPQTNEVYEAGTVLFNNIRTAKEFIEGFQNYPYAEAHLYISIGVDYKNNFENEELLI